MSRRPSDAEEERPMAKGRETARDWSRLACAGEKSNVEEEGGPDQVWVLLELGVWSSLTAFFLNSHLICSAVHGTCIHLKNMICMGPHLFG